MGKYYDGTKLLSMTDINGNKPEIYMCTTNRTGGKTTYFGRLCINRFLDKGEKFGLIYRYNYELDDITDKFFKDIGSLFFPNMTMTSKRSYQAPRTREEAAKELLRCSGTQFDSEIVGIFVRRVLGLDF